VLEARAERRAPPVRYVDRFVKLAPSTIRTATAARPTRAPRSSARRRRVQRRHGASSHRHAEIRARFMTTNAECPSSARQVARVVRRGHHQAPRRRRACAVGSARGPESAARASLRDENGKDLIVRARPQLTTMDRRRIAECAAAERTGRSPGRIVDRDDLIAEFPNSRRRSAGLPDSTGMWAGYRPIAENQTRGAILVAPRKPSARR